MLLKCDIIQLHNRLIIIKIQKFIFNFGNLNPSFYEKKLGEL